jgi:small-conductance mechanosensitive channel
VTNDRPTTEAGAWLDEEEPYLSTWAWSQRGTPIIRAIELEATATLAARLRAAEELLRQWRDAALASDAATLGDLTDATTAALAAYAVWIAEGQSRANEGPGWEEAATIAIREGTGPVTVADILARLDPDSR